MPDKNSVVRVGIIGPGGAGRGNTLAFATRDDVEIVAAVDNNERSLDALEKGLRERVESYKQNSFKYYVGEYEFIEMLNKEAPDIVGVFSPHSLHDIHVKYALRAGCHVLVEKPMANVVGDAIAITKIAMANDLHLVGGYQRHYENIYIAARQAIAAGLIGDLQRFEVFLAQRWGGGGWRGDPRFSGGGQPNDSGRHLQDILLWMTGLLPKEVHGTTDMKFEDEAGNVVPKSVEINSYSDVTMDNGATGTITIVGNTLIGFEEWVILEGDEGTLKIKGDIQFIPEGGEAQPLEFQRPEGYPHNKVDQIVGLVKGEYDANYTSGINGIRTSWLTNSILQAGKGPDERNLVNCDTVLEQEGYNRQFVLDFIAEGALRKMY
ncbi:MAG: Gfo/Idh/MocA family oxidoreductase [Candidatus Poribacteria bacterium]|nr:Gfo/Idh/MocA family oxidoreductase [Candidatus Poribacteria bacterium]